MHKMIQGAVAMYGPFYIVSVVVLMQLKFPFFFFPFLFFDWQARKVKLSAARRHKKCKKGGEEREGKKEWSKYKRFCDRLTDNNLGGKKKDTTDAAHVDLNVNANAVRFIRVQNP